MACGRVDRLGPQTLEIDSPRADGSPTLTIVGCPFCSAQPGVFPSYPAVPRLVTPHPGGRSGAGHDWLAPTRPFLAERSGCTRRVALWPPSGKSSALPGTRWPGCSTGLGCGERKNNAR
jgi:hypothetical protein